MHGFLVGIEPNCDGRCESVCLFATKQCEDGCKMCGESWRKLLSVADSPSPSFHSAIDGEMVVDGLVLAERQRPHKSHCRLISRGCSLQAI